MNPANPERAGALCMTLMKQYYRGAASETKRRRLGRARIIGDVIWRRFQVGAFRWQQKHVRWFLEVHLGSAARNSRYLYWLSVRDLIRSIGKEGWLPHLKGEWTKPS